MAWNWAWSWSNIGHVLVSGLVAYAALIVVLRLSGKRTLSKMNAFDLVVTVALGSSLSSVILQNGISVAEGIAGFAALIGLQFFVAWLSVRSAFARRIFKSSPRILLREGKMDEAALHDERVTAEEVLAAIRGAGGGDIAEIAAVVLETDGSFSVISQERAGTCSALAFTP